MGGRSKAQLQRDELVAKIPEGAARVLVLEESGRRRWRDVADLGDKDEILTKKNGSPIIMMKQPGRKQNVHLVPANDTVKAILERKKEMLGEDPILKLVKDTPRSSEVLQEIVVGLTEEAASIKFERLEAERKGKETSTLSLRRINALRAAGDTILKREEQLSARGVNPDSKAFRAAFEYIVTTMQEAMNGTGIRNEAIEAAFARFSEIVGTPEWEAELQNVIKGVAG